MSTFCKNQPSKIVLILYFSLCCSSLVKALPDQGGVRLQQQFAGKRYYCMVTHAIETDE